MKHRRITDWEHFKCDLVPFTHWKCEISSGKDANYPSRIPVLLKLRKQIPLTLTFPWATISSGRQRKSPYPIQNLSFPSKLNKPDCTLGICDRQRIEHLPGANKMTQKMGEILELNDRFFHSGPRSKVFSNGTSGSRNYHVLTYLFLGNEST